MSPFSTGSANRWPDPSASGKVDFKYLGISFTIPEGWVGQEVDGGYLMGSHTEPGLVMLMLHDLNSIDALRANAKQGIHEEGVMLQPAGELEAVGTRGIGGDYSGVLSGQQVKAYIIGLVNPHGNGMSIMVATEPAKYGAAYRKLALAVANSTQFVKAEIPPVVEQWKQTLPNMRLTYMDSHYSSGSGYDGYSTGGGYSSKTQIDLCGAGHFKHSSRSSMSIDTGGASGSSSDRSSVADDWACPPKDCGGVHGYDSSSTGHELRYNALEAATLNTGCLIEIGTPTLFISH